MAKAPRFRRMTDIDRLAQQYSRSINELTGQYETSFSEYQKQVAQQLAPFEEASTRYKTEILPAYEQQAQNYRKRLADYQKSLGEIGKNPFEEQKILGSFKPYGKTYEWGYVINNQWYSAKNLPEGYVEESPTGDFALKKKSIPKFTEKAPVAPTAPTAPEVAAFDASQFEQRRGQLQEEYGREVGERRAGRLAAVSRRSRRPMLQGA
jgi:hypothetical protein